MKVLGLSQSDIDGGAARAARAMTPEPRAWQVSCIPRQQQQQGEDPCATWQEANPLDTTETAAGGGGK